MTHKNTVVVPARGGSKRLPKKNMLDFAGKPLIGHTIEAALASNKVSKVIVSTDCEEIAEYSLSMGADVPGLRPSDLANDNSTTADVVNHLVEHSIMETERIIVLQPTSPLRSTLDIDKALEVFEKFNALNVVSVSRVSHPIEWTGIIKPNLSMKNFLSLDVIRRSQDLPQRYQLNGAIYIMETDAFIQKKTLVFNDDKSFAYIMPESRSIDIDDELSFDIAEFLYKRAE